jgi:hypothetical protein
VDVRRRHHGTSFGRTQWLLTPGAVFGLDAHRAVDGKPIAICPLPHRPGVITRSQAEARENAQQPPAPACLHVSDGVGFELGRCLGVDSARCGGVARPYLLTQMLLPRLRESAPSRIINLSPGGMYATGVTLDDLRYEKTTYDGSRNFPSSDPPNAMLYDHSSSVCALPREDPKADFP